MPKRYLPNIRDQYEAYPFPKRDPEQERSRVIASELEMLGKINHFGFAGRQSFGPGFRALVAGGGTGDSAIFLAEQLRKRGGRVTYLDLSRTSMETAQARAAVRNLANIEWVHGSILDLPEMGLAPFDYINCAGVLHHLADPDEGLRCLAAVVKEDGCLGLMVYGRLGRIDIYATQELMRHLTAGEPSLAERVALAKEVLTRLPPNNILMRGRDRKATLDLLLDDEPNLVDALLHEQDRAYNVAEIYTWLDQAGLKLVEFSTYQGLGGVCRLEYDPALYLEGLPVLERVRKLPLPIQQTIAESINGSMGLHGFYAAKRAATIARLDDPAMVPNFLTTHAIEVCRKLAAAGPEGIAVTLRFEVKYTFRPHPATQAFLTLIDGQSDMAAILSRLAAMPAVAAQGLDRAALMAKLVKDFDILAALQLVVLRHRDAPPIGTIVKSYA
ncbi:MAG: class I SAM-dependent methyltransferase [Rhodospirillales bacterium]|nr:class I SAM-dependent methyltransferase [Rhodospirillales bacterium]